MSRLHDDRDIGFPIKILQRESTQKINIKGVVFIMPCHLDLRWTVFVLANRLLLDDMKLHIYEYKNVSFMRKETTKKYCVSRGLELRNDSLVGKNERCDLLTSKMLIDDLSVEISS